MIPGSNNSHQHAPGANHIVPGWAFEGGLTSELARVQALQEEALLLEDGAAIQLLQPVRHPHYVLPVSHTSLSLLQIEMYRHNAEP